LKRLGDRSLHLVAARACGYSIFLNALSTVFAAKFLSHYIFPAILGLLKTMLADTKNELARLATGLFDCDDGSTGFFNSLPIE
jgi:hypothetical protein